MARSTVRWGGSSGTGRSCTSPTETPPNSSVQASRRRGWGRLHGPSAGAVLAVAARRPHGGRPSQLVQQAHVVDVARVQDGVHAREGVERLRPQRRARLGDVRVRDQADAHGAQSTPLALRTRVLLTCPHEQPRRPPAHPARPRGSVLRSLARGREARRAGARRLARPVAGLPSPGTRRCSRPCATTRAGTATAASCTTAWWRCRASWRAFPATAPATPSCAPSPTPSARATGAPSIPSPSRSTATGATAWRGTRDKARRERRHCALVATVSLGESRRFLVRPHGGGPSLAFSAGWGDLLVMGGACQRDWEHCVPKAAAAGPRISVMFRSTADFARF